MTNEKYFYEKNEKGLYNLCKTIDPNCTEILCADIEWEMYARGMCKELNKLYEENQQLSQSVESWTRIASGGLHYNDLLKKRIKKGGKE